jgi:hypothetical protein
MAGIEDLLKREMEKRARAMEGLPPGFPPAEVFEKFQQAVMKDMEPYLKDVNEGFDRVLNLLSVATAHPVPVQEKELRKSESASQDIMRSAVVLTHAYLEDFLRTLGKNFLPIAAESTLNTIPLVGLNENGRPEKFFLGKLARHRGKLVDEVIRESISEHLGRTSFNSVTEVVTFLTQLGFGLTPEGRELLPAIDAMIRRRHLIVHHADRIEGQVQRLGSDVFEWLGATRLFLQTLLTPIASKKYTAQLMQEKFNIKITES